MSEELLIESVRPHECLYNNKIKKYKDSTLKQVVWEEISAKLGMPVSECKIKWHRLRNAYLHALARRKSLAEQGRRFKKWKYEDQISFLLPFMSQKDTVSNFEQIHIEQDNDSSRIQEENSDGESINQGKKYKVDYHDMVHMVKEKRQKEKDEIDLLFESMAKAVKQLPKSEQIKVKLEMTKMIYEAQMKCESRQSSEARSVSSSPTYLDFHLLQ